MSINSAHARTGLLYGLGAYLIWGLLPILFKLLHTVSPGEIVAQRVIWSLLFIGGLIAFGKSLPALRRALSNPRVIGFLAISAALIGFNWLIYVWAVINGHVLAASLGYFLTPLVNVALGMIFLKERLGRLQTASVLLAAIGVAVLAVGASDGLWISLGLAITFGFYGLVRKVAPVEALEGLAIETLILAPFALGWLFWLGQGDAMMFGENAGLSLLLAFGGMMTAVPLLLFSAAARRMPYAELGLLQYVAPTLQFLLAVVAYGEPMTQAHVICFAFIWTGLAIYAAGNIANLRRARPGLA